MHQNTKRERKKTGDMENEKKKKKAEEEKWVKAKNFTALRSETPNLVGSHGTREMREKRKEK